MRLTKFQAFLNKFQPKHQSILHLATTVQRYFYFAEVQVGIFKEKMEQMYSRSNEDGFSDACYSTCFAVYAHMRTCLEANRRLANELQRQSSNTELQEFRNQHLSEIESIINIANDIVKHPLDKDGKVYFYEPGGFDNSGEVTVYEWSSANENHFELPKIHPVKALQTVFNYLEGIAEVYYRIIDQRSNKFLSL